jgi:hypothetical protein
MMIAMGMLVDNAIVVTEGMITRIKQGPQPPGISHRGGCHHALSSACGHGYRDRRLCPHWPVE